MGDKTAIQWTDASWNPVRGCTRVSEGCRHCYAEAVAARFSGPGQAYEGLAKYSTHVNGVREPRWTGQLRFVEEHLFDPIRWRRPRRIFVNSMSDLFHEQVTSEQLDRIFAVMALASWHTFQVLTKRPERMLAYLREASPPNEGNDHFSNAVAELSLDRFTDKEVCDTLNRWPLPNVWLGVSTEDQATADERIPLLLETPAAMRFISAEPLLGPVALRQAWRDYVVGWDTESEHGRHDERDNCVDCPVPVQVQTEKLDWVIVGGESGSQARPCDVAWIRGLVQQCQEARVPVFVKQLGSRPVVEGAQLLAKIFVRNRKGGDPSEWPEDLRVRDFPRVAVRS